MTLHTKKTLAFFSTSPLMFKVPQAHNSHRKLFINGLKTKIGEILRSGGLSKCVVFSPGSTVNLNYVHVFFVFFGVTRVRRLVCATSGLRVGSLKNTRASIINCWRLAFLFGLERGGLSELLLLSLIRSHKLYLTSLTSQQHLLLHISIRCVSGCGDLPLADRTPGAPPWRLGQLQVGF